MLESSREENMKILTFGEILLRLAPIGYKKLFQNELLESTFCGSEANVAVSLSNFGLDSRFLTKVPNNDIGISAIRSLNYFGVNTSNVIYGGERLGIYYLEKGASQRPSKVIYDRENSSISKVGLNDFNWDKIFEGVDWFHFSGINPALSESMKKVTIEALKTAKSKNIITSIDLNYREKLWDKKSAQNAMDQIMTYVDVCIGNEEDSSTMLNIKANNTDVNKGKIDYNGYKEVCEQISEKYNCNFVAMSLRKSFSASLNNWSGVLYSKKEKSFFVSNEYEINIIDRVGSGDSFAAGIIYSLISGNANKSGLDFAVASSCLKHTIEGDFNRINKSDVLSLVDGNSSGRIKR